MFKLRASVIFGTVHKAIYVAMMCLGCYFIYQGDIVQRFKQRRTNFAEYTEPITELPTIVTWIQYSNDSQTSKLQFGKDYSLDFQSENKLWKRSTLKIGNNSVAGILIHLEENYNYHWEAKLRLTPQNFSDKLVKTPFSLTYEFKNYTSSVYGVIVSLSSRHSAYCGYGYSMYDGKIRPILARPGEMKKVQIRTTKYVYNPDLKDCREKPYIDYVVDRIYQQMEENCSKPCRSSNFWPCSHYSETRLPVCKTNIENRCFNKAYSNFSSAKDITVKPCTKLQFQVQESTYARRFQIAEFRISFNQPPMTTVKEEYLIYDFVAMLGAIGGTMGLCIGFSFMECARVLFDYVEWGFHWLQKKKGSGPCFTKKKHPTTSSSSTRDSNSMSNEEILSALNENSQSIRILSEKIIEMGREMTDFKKRMEESIYK